VQKLLNSRTWRSNARSARTSPTFFPGRGGTWHLPPVVLALGPPPPSLPRAFARASPAAENSPSSKDRRRAQTARPPISELSSLISAQGRSGAGRTGEKSVFSTAPYSAHSEGFSPPLPKFPLMPASFVQGESLTSKPHPNLWLDLPNSWSYKPYCACLIAPSTTTTPVS
jgi:hypothetical protein